MNTSEPLSEGWPGLERFARTIEKAHGILWLGSTMKASIETHCTN
jgi:hypothetical protein